MAKKKIDWVKVREDFDNGMRPVQIAKKHKCAKGTVSKILKQMGLEVTKAAMPEAPVYVEKKNEATDHLLFLCDKARGELEWIEKSVTPSTNDEYRAWQDQKLKFTAEMRKLINAIADIGYKLYLSNEVVETLKIIDEEIACESPKCQERIRKRLQSRRNLRFPLDLN